MSHHHHCHDCHCHDCHCHDCHCDDCHCDDCHCHEGHCHNHEADSYHETYADLLLEIADEAWMEVVKEKIKEEIRQNSGEHIAALAKLVSSSNNARWKDKMQQKRDNCEFESRLHDLLSSPSAHHSKK